MSNTQPQEYCFIHYYIEDENNYSIEDGLVVQGQNYFCLVGELTDSEIESLGFWIENEFQAHDPYLHELDSGPYSSMSRYEITFGEFISKDFEDLNALADNERESSNASHATDVLEDMKTATENWLEENNNDTTELVEFEEVEAETTDEEYNNERDRNLLICVFAGHDDYQNALAKTPSVTEEISSPYRILYEIHRKADLIRGLRNGLPGAKTQLPSSVTVRVSQDNASVAEAIQSATPEKTVKVSNTDGQKQIIKSKTGGRPRSRKIDWLAERRNEGGVSYRDVCIEWNELTEIKRKEIAPNDFGIFKWDTREDQKASIDRTRKNIKRRNEEAGI